jgi:hypothetical protein
MQLICIEQKENRKEHIISVIKKQKSEISAHAISS